jgi:hypothetical protein
MKEKLESGEFYEEELSDFLLEESNSTLESMINKRNIAFGGLGIKEYLVDLMDFHSYREYLC